MRLQHALQRFLGQRCALCGQALTPEDKELCTLCAQELAPRIAGYCPRCGLCFAESSSPISLCLVCRLTPPAWVRVGFHAPYDGLLRELVHRLKFQHDLGLLTVLGKMLEQAWKRHQLEKADLLVPVPLGREGLRQRGFNQSLELARLLAKNTGMPVHVSALCKIRQVERQADLSRNRRFTNVQGAFCATQDMRGKSVLLVDDVLTTGATVRECTKACLGVGARQVSVLVLARTV